MTRFTSIDGTKLSRKERSDALGALIFLTQKRDGNVKSRKRTDGRGQHGTITKVVEDASPTVSPEAIFITAAIEAHDGRDVAVLDLPGVFIYAEIDKHTIMVLKGKLTGMTAMIEPNCTGSAS